MKDNFDLRKFLVENKLTETGRATRYKFNKPINLYEMEMPADDFSEDDDELGVYIPVDDDPYEAEGPLGVEPDEIEEGKIDRDALYREYIGYETKYGRDKAFKIFAKFHPEIKNINSIFPRFARQNQVKNDAADQKRLNNVLTFDQHQRSSDEPIYNRYGDRVGNTVIDEAGYTDDEDDYAGGDDLNFSAGDSLVNALSGGNKKAKKAFDRTNDINLDADEAPEFSDTPDEGDEESFEDPAQMSDAPVANGENYASKLQYDPEGIELEMGDEELNQFLLDLNPRNPQRPLKVLQRAINAAQQEANEGSVKKFYLVLDRGFYKTVAFRKGNVIATVHKISDQ